MRVAAAIFLAGLAAAVPTPRSDVYQWAVTEWKAGCVTYEGCSYEFKICGPAAGETEKPYTPARPAFEAKCAGFSKDGIETDFAECERTAGDFTGYVTSRMHQPPQLLGVNTVAPIEVALVFADPKGQPNTYYNVTGFANSTFNTNLNQGPLSFNIIPQFIVGVA